jgi:hypothetical protein
MTPPSFATLLTRREGALDDPPTDSAWDYAVICSEGPTAGAMNLTYEQALLAAQEALEDMLGCVTPEQEVEVWTVHTMVASASAIWTINAQATANLFAALRDPHSSSDWVKKETIKTVQHPRIAELLRADAAINVDDDLH